MLKGNEKHTARREIETIKIIKFNFWRQNTMSEVYKKICGMELKTNKTILQRRLMNTKSKNWKLFFKGDRRKQWRIVNGNQRLVEKY